MIEENRAKFHHDNAEISSRKEFVRASRAKVQEIQDNVSGRQAAAKLEEDKRKVLGKSTSSSSSGGAGGGRDERQGRAHKENQDFVENQQRQQVQLVNQQDE